jgi:hypothetical protein
MVKYFTSDEIALHNNPEDCWVSISDDVYNISELINENRGTLANPLIKAAGTSISHWFKDCDREIKTFVDPVRNIQMPYTPYGRFIHVPPPDPLDSVESVPLPWWKNPRYIIGKVYFYFFICFFKFTCLIS